MPSANDRTVTASHLLIAHTTPDLCLAFGQKRMAGKLEGRVELAGIARRYLPRTRRHHHAVRTSILCKLGPESRSNFIMPVFSQFARFTVHLTRWSDCKLKSNSII